MRRRAAFLSFIAIASFAALGLPATAMAVPQAQSKPKVAPPVQPPAAPASQAPVSQPAPPTPAAAPAPETPSAATLGVPFYQGMQFIESYDAGAGQRFFLFGTTASFDDVVTFYKAALKQKGELVFEKPAIHEFDIGRFKEETMAFPPSVTVKDYASGATGGYVNPKPGVEPASYRTVVQIVPIPAEAPPIKR
jgi:hypothetical protein